MRAALIGLVAMNWPLAASAWSPATDLSIVSTATHVISRDLRMRLTNHISYVQEGAQASDETLKSLYPNYDLNPVGAIQREMYLLQAVRTTRVDPYYAYRLGTLGRLVAQVTSPMINRDPAYRDPYYADVETRVKDAEMYASKRMLVDAQAYFLRVARDAQARDPTIEVDYRGGQGFEGIARASLSTSVSRSVDAVADVWFTIFSNTVSTIDMSRSNMTDYVLSSMQYYLTKRKLSEADAVYERVQAIGLADLDVRQRIGDMYFEAELFDKATVEYRAVLEADPTRRAVVKKMALYYERTGDLALTQNRLEDARDNFANAVDTDKLHPTAQRKFFEVEKMILKRDLRLAEARTAVDSAQAAHARAERSALRGKYAEAISLLREAELLYDSVTDEFERESQMANLGQKNVSIRMSEYKGDLITNAQLLSGTGYARSARAIAEAHPGVNEQALRSFAEQEYIGALQQLRSDLEQNIDQRNP